MKAPDDLDIALKLAPSAPHTRYCLGYIIMRPICYTEHDECWSWDAQACLFIDATTGSLDSGGLCVSAFWARLSAVVPAPFGAADSIAALVRGRLC